MPTGTTPSPGLLQTLLQRGRATRQQMRRAVQQQGARQGTEMEQRATREPHRPPEHPLATGTPQSSAMWPACWRWAACQVPGACARMRSGALEASSLARLLSEAC